MSSTTRERYPYDRGEISGEQYWVLTIARDAGTQLMPEQIEWLRRADVAMWSNMNPQMLDWAARLRAEGLQTAVLSNMHADMAKVVRANYAWIRDFHCFVLSAELGLAKPDPQIFRHCLDCLKVQANEALFIDDKERTTRAAEEFGLITQRHLCRLASRHPRTTASRGLERRATGVKGNSVVIPDSTRPPTASEERRDLELAGFADPADVGLITASARSQ